MVAPHDTIVPVESQRGGLADSQTSDVYGVVHADIDKWLTDVGETSSSDVWNEIELRLSESVNSPQFAKKFPNFKGTGNPVPFQTCSNVLVDATLNEAGATVNLEPVRNALFRPGETVPVTLTMTGGNKTDGAMFFFNGQSAIVDGSGTISYSFVAPRDRAGKIEITALTFGPGPDNYLGTTEIFVLPETPPTSIMATPNNLLLSAIGESRELEVIGLFAGQPIDITFSQAGTTYAVKSGTTSIISVSANGMVTARGFGRDSIIVSNAGKTTIVNVLISQTEETASLPVASVSSASYFGPSLSPESIASAFGLNLAETVQSASTIPLPTSLVGTTVKVRDSVGTERLAPLFYVSPNQINYQIPPGTALGPATVTVTSGDGSVSIGSVQIEGVSPGLFSADSTGKGLATGYIQRVKSDKSQVIEPIVVYDQAQQKLISVPIDVSNPSEEVYLAIYGTGIRFNSGLANVGIKVGGKEAQVLYAREQGYYVGLDQINLRLARELGGKGEVDIELFVNGKPANTVKVYIK